MNRLLVAKASITIDAPIAKVWDALINPKIIPQYFFGTQVESQWRPGSAIVWKGEWQGKRYEDKGTILRLEPQRLLEYTHYSPLSGDEDVPGSYHTVTIELSGEPPHTLVSLAQDSNSSEQERAHSEENWHMVLGGLKKLLEK